MTRLMIGSCAVALALTASAAPAQESGARAAIEANNKQFSALVAKGDAAGVAAMYTTNAEVFPPNAAVVRGRAEIEKTWQSLFASGIAGIALTTNEVESAGDLAVETGAYEIKGKDGKSLDRGKFIVVWKRTGGKWLLHRDIWNTSQPAPTS